jgi:PPK2 family polyphosphate:nucleotide phosphotransferase
MINLDKYKAINTVSLTKFSSIEVENDAKKTLKKVRKHLAKIQDAMYAEHKHSLLICLQGMDTSGKDSLIREVFKNVNANGVNVQSFKVPSSLELSHDYLWRHYIALPEKGKITVFNRTHYENVLVTRVHPSYILSESIPSINSTDDIDAAFYHKRMQQINDFEKHLVDNGTIILKFYLHLSKDEQKNRLLRRLDLPEKNWKFSEGDLKERKLWTKYMNAYEDMLSRTSTEYAPWYIIPADNKAVARLRVGEILVEELANYNFKYPILGENEKNNIKIYRDLLKNE